MNGKTVLVGVGAVVSVLDIVFLWIAGIWAVLVLTDAEIAMQFFGRYFLRDGWRLLQAILAGWIPLALFWFTIRWARK